MSINDKYIRYGLIFTVLGLWIFVIISLILFGVSFVFESFSLPASWALRSIFLIFTLFFLILSIFFTTILAKYPSNYEMNLYTDEDDQIFSGINQNKSDYYRPPSLQQNSKKVLEDYYEEDTYYSGLDPMHTI